VQSTPFYFVADIATGKVTALPPGETPPSVVSPQLIGVNTGVGSALQVSSTNLFSYPGNPGWRAFRLRVTNNMPALVGQLPSGEVTGLDLIFTSLVFKKAGGVIVRTVPDLAVSLQSPRDVIIDLANSTATSQIVYLACADSYRIYRIVRDPTDNTTDSVDSVAGGGAFLDAATGNDLMLDAPYGLDADLCNGFWLVESSAKRVYYLRLEPGADPRTATAAQYQVVQNLTTIADPKDCSVDDHGNVFVANGSADKITRVDADGTLTNVPVGLSVGLGACVVNHPGTICYFKSANTDRVYQLRLTGANPKLAASWTVAEMTDGGTGYRDGSGLVAKFGFSDSGMALDASGSLYLADFYNHRIRRIDRIAGE